MKLEPGDLAIELKGGISLLPMALELLAWHRFCGDRDTPSRASSQEFAARLYVSVASVVDDLRMLTVSASFEVLG